MKYDVALSFAGEDREYVEQVAGYLQRARVKVFYDRYEQVDLWGKDLYEHLNDLYKNQARFTVMFISRYYAEKLWTRHERKSAQERAFHESAEYILPVRFDDVDVPGLSSTTGYLDLRQLGPAGLADAITAKLVRSGAAVPQVPARSRGETVIAASGTSIRVLVRAEDGRAIEGATVLLVAEIGTFLEQRTGGGGAAVFGVEKRRKVTVFCAHPDYASCISPDFDPVQDLQITMAAVPGTGSAVSLRGHSPIPGLTGTMNPIHDAQDRLYVYAKNVAIDGGKGQPVHFTIGQELHLEDADGHELLVTFVAVIADCFLMEHRSVE